jgi:hypothetical protein
MATGKKVLKFVIADNATVLDLGLKRLKLVGCRLVAGSAADATSKIQADDSNGETLYSLAAVQKTTDDSAIPTICESGKIYVTLAGAGAEVYLYLE